MKNSDDSGRERTRERSMMPAAKDRFFEDYVAGSVYEFGSIEVSQADILEFGKRYDPQYLHVDRERAANGPYGGLIASGWQTMALAMRLFVDNFLPDGASQGSPGIDELQWLGPVRPGDVLRIRVTVLQTRISQSRPDRGLVQTRVDVLNQRDETVAMMRAVNFIARREASR
jgi:acyl dehydratase